MKRILLKGIDGSVSIMQYIGPPEELEEAIRKFRDVHAEGAYPEYEEVDNLVLPENRLFRDAWSTVSKGTVEIKKDKAEEIHMGRIRKERDKELGKLDVEMLKNLKDSDKLEALETKKQVLRDIPQTFDMSGMDLKHPDRTWPDDVALTEEYK